MEIKPEQSGQPHSRKWSKITAVGSICLLAGAGLCWLPAAARVAAHEEKNGMVPGGDSRTVYELVQEQKRLEEQLANASSKEKEELQSRLDTLKPLLECYEAVAMYRLYNPNSGEHHYTASLDEVNGLEQQGWKNEGTGFLAPKQGIDVYRLYNPAGEHHYTISEQERDALTEAGWKDEGVAWHSFANGADVNSAAVWRLYNPNASLNAHHYTISKSEQDALLRQGWSSEGTGWYGLLPVSRVFKADGIYYYDNLSLEPLKGEQTILGDAYCFDDQGKMQTGLCLINGNTYGYGLNGHKLYGTQVIDGKTYQFDGPNGSALEQSGQAEIQP